MKVLIAIDETSFLDCIENFVTGREWPPHTTYRVLHVTEPLPPMAGFLPAPIVEMIRDDARKFGEHLVRRMAMRIRDYFKTEHVEELVIEGKPKELIVEHATAWGADLVVMGTHNKNMLDRMTLGSVSGFVLNTAPCSVAVTRCTPASSEVEHSKDMETARK